MSIIFLAISVLTVIAGIIHLLAQNTETAIFWLGFGILVYIIGKLDARRKG